MKRWQANMLLLLAAIIWGAAFTAQSVGMEHLGPFSFNAIRFLLGGIVMLPFVALRQRSLKKSESGPAPGLSKRVILTGVICGLLLTMANSIQQIGLLYTSPGKAGFITALYVIIVPVIGLFFGSRHTLRLWISVAIAVVGMYLLCVSDSFTIEKGDILIIICAFIFAVHIMTVDKKAHDLDGMTISCIQFLTTGILCSVIVPFTDEVITFEAVKAAAVPLLYAGIFSCSFAYTFQIVGQQHTTPTAASLLLSTESVFAAIAAWVLIGDTMTAREIIGGLLSFFAVILSQLPSKRNTANV
ncbi:MAG: DMT family transporter [Lachnospiraceae bacterium]|nr:DMT family transporter [Lachnospiraceae bacterium]